MRERVKSGEPPSKNERTAIGDLFIANTGAVLRALILHSFLFSKHIKIAIYCE